jgi:signal transduction histidine kinase
MAAVGAVSAVIGVTWLYVLGHSDIVWNDWVIHNALVAVSAAAIAWLVVPSQPRNAEIWVFGWTSVLTGLLCLAYALGGSLAGDLGSNSSFLELVPADLSLPAALAMMNANWLWMGVFLPFTLGLLLLPDGKPPSSRWRWFTWLVIALLGLTAAGLFWEARPSGVHSYVATQDMNGGFRSLTSTLVTIGYPAIFGSVLGCVAGLVVRFRRSSGVERQQIRWVVWGASVAGVLMVGALFVDELGGRVDVALVFGLTAMATLLFSFAVSIGRYRLYDIDLVISKTLTFGALGVFIAAMYALVVVGVGTLIHQADEPNLWLSIGATAIIAVLFEPIHTRIRRVANRFVYGDRATPYTVLSQVSSRLASADESGDPLMALAEVVAGGTGAHTAHVWVRIGPRLARVAGWPPHEGPDRIEELDGGELANLGHEHAIPVLDNDEIVGALGIDKPRADPVNEADRRLLADVAGAASLLLRNRRLTAELAERAQQLRASRRRLVAAHDAERHRLERDLHDGAQQQVVALKVKLGLAKAVAEREGAQDVASVVGGLVDDTQEIVDAMRLVARGIYPPLLEAEGLGAALNAIRRTAQVPVAGDWEAIGRYAGPLEQTIYFCVLESVEAAVRSGAGGIEIIVREDARDLLVVIDHDGAHTPGAVETVSDRVDAAGGTFDVQIDEGGYVRVRCRIPLESSQLEPA